MSNYFIIKKDNKKGVVDTLGNEIIPVEYDNIEMEENNIFRVENHSEKIYESSEFLYNAFDKTSSSAHYQILVSSIHNVAITHDVIEYRAKDGSATKEKLGLISIPDLTEIVAPLYDKIRFSDESDCHLAFGKLNEKYTIINLDTKIIIESNYDDICPQYYKGAVTKCMMVYLTDKVGLIDNTGKEILPPIYDDISLA